jgi:predicted CopG family antitoxin
MAMSRKTITISEEAYNALDGEKREGESFTELAFRAAEALEDGDGAANTDPNTLTEEHIDDIGTEVEDRLQRILENAHLHG